MSMDRKEFEQFLENINFKNPMGITSWGIEYTYEIVGIDDFVVSIGVNIAYKDGRKISYHIRQQDFDGAVEYLKMALGVEI